MLMKVPRTSFLLLIISLVICHSANGGSTQKQIEQPIRKAIDTRQATQEAEAKWRLDKEKLTIQYEQLEKKKRQLEEKVQDLNRLNEASRMRVTAKEKQLSDIKQISGQIEPFVATMIEELKTQVTDGYPFLSTERKQRIERLNQIGNDPDVPISEKYRKAMEALLVEAEYGFTIETYQDTITIDGEPLLADIFRLGRISLFYQSLDQKHCGFFNVATNQWDPLPQADNLSIRSAIDIAAKRKPVELLSMPVGRLVVQ